MRSRLLLVAGLIIAPLMAADRSIALQEVRLELDDFSHQLKCQKSDIEIVHDKLSALQATIDSLRDEGSSAKGAEWEVGKEKLVSLDKRISALEKNNKTLATDLKTIKDHLNESTESLAKCQTKLNELDKQLSSDIKGLKGSLQSMLSILQGEKTASHGSKTYVVQPGDSLGKIAIDHHLSIKELKELNHLAHDQIIVGQKLTVSK